MEMDTDADMDRDVDFVIFYDRFQGRCRYCVNASVGDNIG